MNKLPFSTYDIFGYVISGLVILATIQLTTDTVKIFGANLQLFEQLLVFIGAYVIGHLVATPSKAIMEDWFVHRVLGGPAKILMDEPGRTAGFFRSIFRTYFTPLPKAQQDKVLEKLDDKSVLNDSESLFLRVRYSDEIRGDDQVQERLMSFLNLYGFSRNLSFTFFGCGIVMIGARIFTSVDVPGIYIVVSMVLGLGFLYRYLKFFRHYSFEMLNSYGSKTN